MPGTGSGTSFASLSASPNGISIARATSRITPRALSWWNVAIWPTLVLAVLLLDVLDDLVAPVHAEVDVEVGHRHALGVQEALEQQVELERIEVGDAQRVRDERAGARAAARPDRDAVLLRPVDEVPDDEEVAREPHLLDDAELDPAALAVLVGIELDAARGELAEPALEALVDELADVRVERLALGDLERRQVASDRA